MNFLACDGSWQVGAGGESICVGTLQSITGEEMQTQFGTALSWDEVTELRGDVITLFAIVFGFLVLKKLL